MYTPTLTTKEREREMKYGRELMSRFGSSAVKLSSVSRRGKPPVLNVCLKIFVVVVVVVVVASISGRG